MASFGCFFLSFSETLTALAKASQATLFATFRFPVGVGEYDWGGVEARVAGKVQGDYKVSLALQMSVQEPLSLLCEVMNVLDNNIAAAAPRGHV